MYFRILLALKIFALIFGLIYSFKPIGYRHPRTRKYLPLLGMSKLYKVPDIQIITAPGCKYCRIAKAALSDLGATYYEINTDSETEMDLNPIEKSRLEHAKKSTVPQIYVKNELIGGCDNLLAEIKNNTFVERLKRNKISLHFPVNPTASKMVHEIANATNITQSDMIATSKYALNEIMNNDTILLAPETTPEILNLSKQLQKQSLVLQDIFASEDGSNINYNEMKTSKEFQEYIKLSSQLKYCDPEELSNLPESTRLSFFINIYNALIIHAKCIIGAPQDSPQHRTAFFNGSTGAYYNIGGYNFSPDDIEHGILRANAIHPSMQGKDSYFNIEDIRSKISLKFKDPRIHFALNCGAKSCPPIRIYGEDPNPALNTAAAAYLSSELVYDASTHTLKLPKLAMWYALDFGSNLNEQINTLVTLASKEKQEEISSQLAKKTRWNLHKTTMPLDEKENNTKDNDDNNLVLKVIYNDYNWQSNEI